MGYVYIGLVNKLIVFALTWDKYGIGLYTVKCSYQDITHGTVMTTAERKLHFKLTTETPFLAQTGDPWRVYCDDCLRKLTKP